MDEHTKSPGVHGICGCLKKSNVHIEWYNIIYIYIVLYVYLWTKGANPPKSSDLDCRACQRSPSTNKLFPRLMWLNANQNPPCSRLKYPLGYTSAQSEQNPKYNWNIDGLVSLHSFSRWRSLGVRAFRGPWCPIGRLHQGWSGPAHISPQSRKQPEPKRLHQSDEWRRFLIDVHPEGQVDQLSMWANKTCWTLWAVRMGQETMYSLRSRLLKHLNHSLQILNSLYIYIL